jgi:thymidylate synthase (FAD)
MDINTSEGIDILKGKKTSIGCLDHGCVELIDVMPRITQSGTAEDAIVRAARVSYGGDLKQRTRSQDIGLICYLLVNNHTSPFEMACFTFHICMPIFVMRQFVRHRTFKLNEYSMRYSDATSVLSDVNECWYKPIKTVDDIRLQSKNNKQMSSDEKPDLSTGIAIVNLFARMDELNREMFKLYENATTMGVSREVARVHLPLSTYTRIYASMDLHNLMKFLQLRLHEHAQEEIRVYAQAIMDLIEPLVPNVIKIFKDSRINSLYFTESEAFAILKTATINDAVEHLGYSKRRENDFRERVGKLGY